jgi:hypothetical protein
MLKYLKIQLFLSLDYFAAKAAQKNTVYFANAFKT